MTRSTGSTAPIPPTESDAEISGGSGASVNGMEEEHKFWLQRSLQEAMLVCFEVGFAAATSYVLRTLTSQGG